MPAPESTTASQPQSLAFRPTRLSPVTLNPVIRMCRLGPLLCPEGPERNQNAERQKLAQDNFASQLPRSYPHLGGSFERAQNLKPGISERIWARVIASQKLLQDLGTGDSQRDSRESIRANHSQLRPYFYSASGRFARITRMSDSHESPDSRESCASECTKIAHRRSLAIFAADSGIAGNSAMGIKFVPFNRRENRRSLAIFFAKEIAHLGALKIARFCGGAVKIAAATAENRAILVHSGANRFARITPISARQ